MGRQVGRAGRQPEWQLGRQANRWARDSTGGQSGGQQVGTNADS